MLPCCVWISIAAGILFLLAVPFAIRMGFERTELPVDDLSFMTHLYNITKAAFNVSDFNATNLN
jgi:hypothetical protein